MGWIGTITKLRDYSLYIPLFLFKVEEMRGEETGICIDMMRNDQSSSGGLLKVCPVM